MDALGRRQLAPAHCPETSRCPRQRFATWLGRTSFETHPQARFRRVQPRSPSTTRYLLGGLVASCEARATSSSRPTEEERPRRAEARVLAAIALQQWRLQSGERSQQQYRLEWRAFAACLEGLPRQGL